MNKAILTGRLTRDPEHRLTQNNLSVTTFSIAVNRRFTSGDKKADFLNIITWRGLADNCAKYLEKGSLVGVVGEIQTRDYTDKNGVKRYVTEIVAEQVDFLSTKSSSSSGSERTYGGQPEDTFAGKSAQDLFGDELAAFEPVNDEELPF
jgi:single-strand DNA-binding protein